MALALIPTDKVPGKRSKNHRIAVYALRARYIATGAPVLATQVARDIEHFAATAHGSAIASELHQKKYAKKVIV